MRRHPTRTPVGRSESLLVLTIFVTSLAICVGTLWFLALHYGVEDPVTVALVIAVGTFFSFWPVLVVVFLAFMAVMLSGAWLADWMHS